MDKFDARILSLLQDDGRLSWSRLAEEISLSASACQRRVEALVERGVIENFTVALNEENLATASRRSSKLTLTGSIPS